MLRILMLLLGIYLILYGARNKYLAIPCSTLGERSEQEKYYDKT